MATHQDADVGGRDAKLTCDLGDREQRLIGHAGRTELVDEPDGPDLALGVPGTHRGRRGSSALMAILDLALTPQVGLARKLAAIARSAGLSPDPA